LSFAGVVSFSCGAPPQTANGGNRSSTHVKNKLLSFIKGKAGNIRDLLPWAFGFS
jgi:hypothetical protein